MKVRKKEPKRQRCDGVKKGRQQRLGTEESKLKLVNEIKDSKEKLSDIPQSTEKIILQAEKYLKK